ncbi:nuclear transport factor 2 family protein [Synoicihabitans lomoniglobus]|uniref:Nuclear transport factor 2 family protein n=1 Tax=Synoicihabitans lomoniglobus TaxID=2909285 RepID=A0AAF0A0J9_9BACT|nr:nuclear transport factor 2 family protein [Opitutaceae bacterium LMO-M01]WED64282.1 nuclear transport factor 2 family protein [Opitutaceae bacterium LMO-M01]
MNEQPSINTTRRNFLVKGGAVLGAGLASATALAGPRLLETARPDDASELQHLQQTLARLTDQAAIRELQRTCIGMVARGAYGALAELCTPDAEVALPGIVFAAAHNPLDPREPAESITDVRQPADCIHDEVTINENEFVAHATCHSQVEISTPFRLESTLETMARLQGQSSTVRWESGRFEMTFAKPQGHWLVSRFTFQA